MQTNWNLKHYFYPSITDPQLQNDIDGITTVVKAFADQWRNNIKNIQTADELKKYYEEADALYGTLEKPGLYLGYVSSLDTQNTEVLKKLGELQNKMVELEQYTLFIEQEFKAIGAEKLLQLAQAEILLPWKNAIVGKAENLQYLLSEKEEMVISEKSKALSNAFGLYDELVGSYEFTVTINGETKTVTEEEVRTMRTSPNREIRREAYKSLRRAFNNKQSQITLGNLYSQIVKNW